MNNTPFKLELETGVCKLIPMQVYAEVQKVILNQCQNLVYINKLILDNGFLIKNIPININGDKPDFVYRGVMIDTARHFLKKETIFRTLDALMYQSTFNLKV